MTIPYIGTHEWIESLNLTIKFDWEPWFVDGQVAGLVSIILNPSILFFKDKIQIVIHNLTIFIFACLAIFRYTMLYAYNALDYITYDLRFATVKVRTDISLFNSII